MSQADPAPRPTGDSQSAGLEVVVRHGQGPNDVFELRRQVFRDETRLLSDADIASPDDEIGAHVCLYHHGKLAGAALGVAAERSSFSLRSSVNKA